MTNVLPDEVCFTARVLQGSILGPPLSGRASRDGSPPRPQARAQAVDHPVVRERTIDGIADPEDLGQLAGSGETAAGSLDSRP